MNSWSVFLDFASSSLPNGGTVFVLISLGWLFSVEGPLRGRLAALQHSSSLHQRPPRSAILGLSAPHKRTAAQRVKGEGRDGRCRRLSEIVSKSGIRDEMNGEKREECVYACVHLCAPHCAPACLHMFPCVSNVCFAQFAAMPTILRAPSQLEWLKRRGAKEEE